MRIAIIQFPGSNCERETMLAVKRAGMEPHEFLWNQPKETLASFDGFIIVGGFSYEDRSRAGVIAALDPIMDIIKQQSELGKPILGICNGAQILVESGLVPGVEKNKVSLVLTDNKRIQNGKVLGTGFYNAWVHMRLADNYQYNAFTRKLTPDTKLHIPVAHAEGRFVIPGGLLKEMQENGLAVFQYCDAKGAIIDEFPVNPNGSTQNIAAISNKAGNVMAMMPHPERTSIGDVIFHSMKEYIADGYKQKVAPLNYYPRAYEIKKYQPKAHELIVDLIITDNQALSVESALKHLNIPVRITRAQHWEIDCDSLEEIQKIKSSGVLYNDRKEKLIKIDPANTASLKQQTGQLSEASQPIVTRYFLVHAKEDMIGQQKLQMLKDHFGIEGVRTIRHSILWRVQASSKAAIDQVADLPILFNASAHDCYAYEAS
jgi:phosphoribosylformylglycinamidine synthase